ncbi:MAG TPA: GAF domain-containing protein [Dongiaceae bacterium]|nr:GAF domain-containing protein [Dongiaceae bacterium]
MIHNLAAELEVLANNLPTGESSRDQLSVTAIAEKIAKSFDVRPEEVGILAVSGKWRHLYFLAPVALRHVGFVPLSSTTALAARTAREAKAEIENKFAATRHASVFEGVKADTLSSTAIQKILSTPILNAGKVVGVLQISRKAPTPAEAGPDFTSEDLRRASAICRPLGKIVAHLAKE